MKKVCLVLSFMTLLAFDVNAQLIPSASNGNYTVTFTEVPSGSEDFTYKELQNDGTIREYHYKISYTPAAQPSDQIRVVNNASGNVVRDFVEISTSSTGTSPIYDTSFGGAINNKDNNLDSITGDFIKNSNTTTASYFTSGGAIYNYGKHIGIINSNFIGNYSKSDSYKAYGGAIANYDSAYIGNIIGDFIGNYSEGITESFGGAIYNDGTGTTIANITGDFIGNSANAGGPLSDASGGAIYNNGASIGDIKGNFIGNNVQSNSYSAYGGAIYNRSGSIGNISGDFINNYTTAISSHAVSGGAIFNFINASIGDIKGNFIGNNTISEGGAIYNNSAIIGRIDGDFVGNYAKSNAPAYGGAIYNRNASIGDIYGNFIDNFADSANNSVSGGTIYNYNNAKIGNIIGNFVDNHASASGSVSGGVIYNEESSIKNISGIFKDNYASASGSAYGGAIYNYNGSINFLSNVSFLGNYAEITNFGSFGGAIYSIYTIYASTPSQTITFSPQTAGESILFENNYVLNGKGTASESKKLSSIHLAGATVDFRLQADTIADIRDPITGDGVVNKDVVNFYDADGNFTGTGDGNGAMYLWGDNREFNGKLNIKTGTFALMFDESDAVWSQRNTANLDNATVNFSNDTIYRPRVSATQLASLNSYNTTVGSNVLFLPYDISSLDIGQHLYNEDYYKFDGWESALAKVDTNYGGTNTKTEITIKRDLAGYGGLGALADIYRKRNDLSYTEREELDYIYYSGAVTQNILDMFAVAEGQDIINYEQAHRGTVRQFNRQIYSRIQNKNCPSCGISAGFSDQHLWFNVGYNWIKKDDTRKTLGYEYKPTSIALGYDTDLIPNEWNIGIALGYAYGEAKTSAGEIVSKNDINEYLISLYTKYKPYRAYISGNLGGGWMRNDTNFRGLGIMTKGDYDAKAFFANTEIGYDFGNACTTLEPYIGAEYTYIRTEGHAEKGEGARKFDSMDWSIFEVPVGLRQSRDFYVNNFILTPSLDVAYVHNFGDTGSSTMARFVGNIGESWKVSSSSDKRDSFRGNFNFKINNLILPFAVNLGYAIDYRSDYTDQQTYITFRWDF